MNTKKNLEVANNYYQSLINRHVDELNQYLHSDVEFSSPAAQKFGKEDVLEWIKGFANAFASINIRAKFENGDQVMMVYDVEFPEMEGSYTTAALLNFKENLIFKFELIFDARPFLPAK